MSTEFDELENDKFDDDIDLDMADPFAEDDPNDSRSPMVKSSGKFLNAMRSEFDTEEGMDRAKEAATYALPDTLKTELSPIANVIESVTSEASKGLTDIKKESRTLVNTLESVVPDDGFFRNMLNKAKDVLGQKEEERGSTPVDEAMEMVVSTIGDRDTLMEKRRSIIDSMKMNMGKSQTELQSTMVVKLSSLEDFQYNLSERYYRRSLELQYRHLYLAKEQSEIFKTSYANFAELLIAIRKNTSLPDVVKSRDSEVMAMMAKQNFINDSYDKYIRNNDWLNNLKKNASNKAKNITGSVVSGLSGANTGMDMYGSMSDFTSPEQLAATSLADLIKTKIGGLVGGQLAKTKMGKKIIDETKDFNIDPQERLRELAENETSGLKRSFYYMMSDMMGPSVSKNSIMLEKDNLDEATIFDGRAHKSITRVIPELLGDILGEIRGIRTKKKPDGVLFDYNLDKFVTKKDVVKNFNKNVSKELVSNGTDRDLVWLVDRLVGKSNINLSKDEKYQFMEGLAEYSVDGKTLHPLKLKNSGFYTLFEPELAAKIELIIDSATKTKGTVDYDKVRDLHSSIGNISSSMFNPKTMLEEYRKSGMTPMLAEQGLINYDENTGRYDITEDQFKKIIKNNLKDAINNEDMSESVKREKSETEEHIDLEDPLVKRIRVEAKLAKRKAKRKAKTAKEELLNKIDPDGKHREHIEEFVGDKKEDIEEYYKNLHLKDKVDDLKKDGIDKANEIKEEALNKAEEYKNEINKKAKSGVKYLKNKIDNVENNVVHNELVKQAEIMMDTSGIPTNNNVVNHILKNSNYTNPNHLNSVSLIENDTPSLASILAPTDKVTLLGLGINKTKGIAEDAANKSKSHIDNLSTKADNIMNAARTTVGDVENGFINKELTKLAHGMSSTDLTTNSPLNTILKNGNYTKIPTKLDSKLIDNNNKSLVEYLTPVNDVTGLSLVANNIKSKVNNAVDNSKNIGSKLTNMDELSKTTNNIYNDATSKLSSIDKSDVTYVVNKLGTTVDKVIGKIDNLIDSTKDKVNTESHTTESNSDMVNKDSTSYASTNYYNSKPPSISSKVLPVDSSTVKGDTEKKQYVNIIPNINNTAETTVEALINKTKESAVQTKTTLLDHSKKNLKAIYDSNKITTEDYVSLHYKLYGKPPIPKDIKSLGADKESEDNRKELTPKEKSIVEVVSNTIHTTKDRVTQSKLVESLVNKTEVEEEKDNKILEALDTIVEKLKPEKKESKDRKNSWWNIINRDKNKDSNEESKNIKEDKTTNPLTDKSNLGLVLAGLGFLLGKVVKGVSSVVKGIWRLDKFFGTKMRGVLKSAAKAVFSGSVFKKLGGLFAAPFVGLKNLLSKGFNSIKSIFSAGLSGIKSVVTGITSKVGGLIGKGAALATGATAAKAAGSAKPMSWMDKMLDKSKKLYSATKDRMVKAGKFIVSKTGLSKLMKVGIIADAAGYAMKGGKYLLKAGKKIPIAGLVIGAGFAAKRALEGDFTGAGLELGAAAMSTVPGIGTAGSLATEAYLIKRDMDREDEEESSPTENSIDKPTNTVEKLSDKAKDTVTPVQPISEYAEALSSLQSQFPWLSRQLGKPWLYGGQPVDNAPGYDSSSLVKAYYKAVKGVEIPRTAYGQSQSSNIVETPIGQIKPGDLLFWKTANYAPVTHVSIYVGNGWVVQAKNDTGVVLTKMYSKTLNKSNLIMAGKVETDEKYSSVNDKIYDNKEYIGEHMPGGQQSVVKEDKKSGVMDRIKSFVKGVLGIDSGLLGGDSESATGDSSRQTSSYTGANDINVPYTGGNTLLDIIANGEGISKKKAARKGYKSEYDVTIAYGKYLDDKERPITSMSIGEVKEFQKQLLRNQSKLGISSDRRSSAVGRYQFISKTLSGLQKELGLPDSAQFSPAVQDKMATKLLKRRGLDKFKAGKISRDEFQLALSQEWASIPNPKTGRSYYGQHVGTPDKVIKKAIDNTLKGDMPISRESIVASHGGNEEYIKKATSTVATASSFNSKVKETNTSNSSATTRVATSKPSVFNAPQQTVSSHAMPSSTTVSPIKIDNSVVSDEFKELRKLSSIDTTLRESLAVQVETKKLIESVGDMFRNQNKETNTTPVEMKHGKRNAPRRKSKHTPFPESTVSMSR